MNLQLVAGLGNPGFDYRDSYHNVGYQSIDRLLREYDHQKTSRKPGTVYDVRSGPVGWLAKPDCYVNESGGVLKAWVESLDIPPEAIFVIYDDFSLRIGEIRVRPGGSAGGHNGMKSIINALGTNSIPRVRIGIGPLPDGVDPADFVLSPIRDSDQSIFDRIFRNLPDVLRTVSEEGFDAAMNEWNGKDLSDGN